MSNDQDPLAATDFDEQQSIERLQRLLGESRRQYRAVRYRGPSPRQPLRSVGWARIGGRQPAFLAAAVTTVVAGLALLLLELSVPHGNVSGSGRDRQAGFRMPSPPVTSNVALRLQAGRSMTLPRVAVGAGLHFRIPKRPRQPPLDNDRAGRQNESPDGKLALDIDHSAPPRA